MLYYRRSRCRPVSLALVGLFVWVTACSSYSQIGLSEIADHGKVRVTTTDGDRTTVHNPRVEADSIKGEDAGAIPVDEVVKLEAVGTDEVGTVFTVLGVFVGVLVVTYLVSCAVSDTSDEFIDLCAF